jgi:hypothetical protein
VYLYHEGTEVFSYKFVMRWRPGKDDKEHIKIPRVVADKVRVDCRTEDVRYVGLAEIKVFSLAGQVPPSKLSVSVDSEVNTNHHKGWLTDGTTDSSSANNWSSRTNRGWVELEIN